MKILFPIDMTHPAGSNIEQVSALLPLADREVHLLYVNEAWPAYENVLGVSANLLMTGAKLSMSMRKKPWSKQKRH